MSGVFRITDIRTIFRSFLLFVFLVMSVCMNAQTDKKYIRKGNKEYDKSRYSDSEIFYRKAIDKNKQSPDAVFNIGDALYKQDKYEEAGNQFIESTNETNDKIKKSDGYYNLGNSLLKAKKVKESIEAYKNSLKLHPDNPEAKYNLAYAQDLLKQQEQQQQQNKDQQNKDNKNNDKNKDQNKDKNDQNKDQQKDQDNKQAQNQNQDEKQQQSDKQEISQEDAQRLLNSLANDEKKVQEKVKLAKATKAKSRSVKNW